MTSAAPHLFWITSRAAGIVALVLASLAVSAGLLMSTRLLRKRGPDLVATHEILSLATIVALVVHGVSLLGDQYLRPTVADIAIPFVSGYQTVWTSMGIIAGWALMLLGLSYYARRRIGSARWRSLHRLTALAWLAGIAHSLGEGTDAGQTVVLGHAGDRRGSGSDPAGRPAEWTTARRAARPDAPPKRQARGPYRPAGWRTTMSENSPPPRAQRVPSSARATVSNRQPATSIHTWPALA